MKIVACYKIVPDADKIETKQDRTLSIDLSAVEIGQYDLRAVEEAAKIAEITDGIAVALTVGGDAVANSKMKKAILSRGPSEMFAVQDELLAFADSNQTAKALKAAICKMDDVDLVICGEGSSDQYNQQVGNMLGGILGWTTVNAVSKIEVVNDKLKIERSVEDGVEIFEINLPAVITVTSDINVPRIPSMKDIMAAGKKPATIWSKDDIGGLSAAVSNVKGVFAPEEKERLKNVIEIADEEGINAFVEQIRTAL